MGSASTRRVLALACALGISGALLVLPWVGAPTAAAIRLPVWAVLPLLLAAGLFVVPLRIGRETQEISARDLGLVVGLALVPPGVYVVAHVLASIVPLLVRRTAPLKVLFNSGLFLAEAGAAVATYRLLRGPAPPTSLRGVVATYGAVVVVDLLGSAAVAAAIRLHAEPSGQAPAAAVLRPRAAALGSGLVVALTGASVALLALVLLLAAPGALPLLVFPVGALGVAYRSHIRLTDGHDRLKVLYAFTRASGTALADDDTAHVVLTQARELMSAETSELHLVPRDGAAGLHLRSSGAGVQVLTSQPAPWWQRALRGEPLHRRPGDPGLGPQDALAMALYEDGHTVGVLVVVDRMGDSGTFGTNDAQVFSALAGTAGVSLHNAGLVARLRAEAVVRELEARHDPLTGLLNRRGLVETVESWPPGPRTALVLELRDGQDVNDALGHETGDELLVAVGRLLDALPDGVVARLNGDEFAVVLPGSDVASYLGLARAQLEAAPVRVHHLDLPIAVTVGSAVAGSEELAPGLLLRRAHLAKNRARRLGEAYAGFEPVDETASGDRLALVRDLRRALEGGELEVWYQPQLDLRTGRVGSVEALVRWTHAVRGPVSPEVFVPLAESSGLVDALTAVVLHSALAQTVRWRSAGLIECVAVNLSARSLTPALAGVLDQALRTAGLPASALTLELTETALVTDAVRAAQVLRELADLGVALSLDDFGTGYSSLSYLRQLPLSEIKVDKSFVLAMTSDHEDAAVVRATVALAHDLGLRVVAEGVEDEASLQALRGLGCDLAQGYHVARPAPAERTTAWLDERGAAQGRAGRLPHIRSA